MNVSDRYNAVLMGLSLSICFFFSACNNKGSASNAYSGRPSDLVVDTDNGGISLATGFGAVVVADEIGRARHMVVRDNGDIYVMLQNLRENSGLVALRDTTGDGRADVIARFGDVVGTGIDIRDGYLYFSSDTSVFRYKLTPGKLAPEGDAELVIGGFPLERQHASKPFAFDDDGFIYVTVGAPANACQEQDRTPGSPGMDPCPLLERYGGIWRFSAASPGQTQELDGVRYATGIRNAVAIAWNPLTRQLYAVQHGRDQLGGLFPGRFTEEQSAELPAEEFFLVDEGANFGWPYCYYDQVQGKKVLAPEYGGDGKVVARCSSFDDPIMAFPGHWAPNDLIFYTGDQFPGKYHGGAFIAFHGSWNRGPKPQQGYKVVFVPFDGSMPSGGYEVFADGFAGADVIKSPRDASHRPMGLAQGADGSLYITDSVRGKIWRVVYKG